VNEEDCFDPCGGCLRCRSDGGDEEREKSGTRGRQTSKEPGYLH
jgi:hypothetical protein